MDIYETLPAELAAKMRAAAALTSEPCPTCGAGRGHFCIVKSDGKPMTGRNHRERRNVTL